MKTTQTQSWLIRLIPLGLLLLTILLYINVVNSRLQYSWDDNRYIVENVFIRDFSLNGVLRIIGDVQKPYFAGYLPTTQMAYMLQYRLWNVQPTGYFVVNMLLHAVNGILVYAFLFQLTGNRAVAVIASVLFIAHPINVESVAWASELKNVLSMMFFLLSWLAHIRASESARGVPWLILSYVLFTLSIFAKPVAVGAFLLFTLYDYWATHKAFAQIIVRNFAYGLIGLIGAAMMLYAHSTGGGIKTHLGSNIFENIALVLRVFWDYFVSIIAPTDLNNMYIYSMPNILGNPLPIVFGLFLLIGMIAFAYWQPLGKPFCAFAMAWIVTVMLPVSNIVPIAIQRADRYMYFPSVMIFMLVGMTCLLIWERFRSTEQRYALSGAGVAVVVFVSILTTQRVAVWQNTQSLWADHLKDYSNGESSTGLLNLSVGYYKDGYYSLAESTLTLLLRYYPDHVKGTRLMGLNYFQGGSYRVAIDYLLKAIKLGAKDSEVTQSLGISYFQEGLNQFQRGEYATALALYSESLPLVPTENIPIVMNNAGYTLQTIGRFDDAIKAYNSALQIKPDYARAWINLGEVYLFKEDYANSKASYAQALALGAQFDAKANSNLCLAKAELKDDATEALQYCQLALNEDPKNGLFLGRTAHALLLYNEIDKALQVAQTAVEVSPNSLVYRTLGDALVLKGDVAGAVDAYKQAIALDANNQKAKDALVRLGVTP